MRNKYSQGLFLVILIIGIITLAGCSLASEPIPMGPIETSEPPDPAAAGSGSDSGAQSAVQPIMQPPAAMGRAIYQESCQPCHGEQGDGNGEQASILRDQGVTFPNFTDPELVRNSSMLDWYTMITVGTLDKGGRMPYFRDSRSEIERWSAAAYLYTFTVTDETLAQGEELFLANCSECHGTLDNLADIDVLALSGSSQADIRQEWILEGDDAHSINPGEDESWALAAYVQSLGYLPLSAADQDQPPAGDAATQEPSGGSDTGSGDTTTDTAPEEPTTGVVSGKVTNETDPTISTAGLDVQFYGWAEDPNGEVIEFMNQTTTTDEEGYYRFEGVPINLPRSIFLVSVLKDGVEFWDGAAASSDQTEYDVPISIYNVAYDAAVVSLELQIFVTEHNGAMLIEHNYIFSNNSSEVFITAHPIAGGRSGSVNVYIPPDGRSLTFQAGELGRDYIESGDRLVSMAPLYPGQASSQIAYYYVVDYGDSRTVEIPIDYQTVSTEVLINTGTIKFKSDMLEETGIETINGQQFTVYTVGEPLAEGDTLSFEVRPADAPITSRSTLALLIGGGLLLLVIGGGAFWYMNRDMPEFDAEEPETLDAYSDDARSLIQEIAALDAAFEAGQINRFDYEERRAVLKAELVNITYWEEEE